MPRKAKVLLIEDNAQNRYLATYLLEHHGFEVVAAVSGRSGLELLQTTKPDLVLLDIQLPDMDGYAVARELKRDQRNAGVPVIAVSSFAMAGDRERAFDAGCDGYIEKPIDPDRFIAQLQPFLRM
jgi:CheY-like chemotaxis protein